MFIDAIGNILRKNITEFEAKLCRDLTGGKDLYTNGAICNSEKKVLHLFVIRLFWCQK